jgi:hypothetical protein
MAITRPQWARPEHLQWLAAGSGTIIADEDGTVQHRLRDQLSLADLQPVASSVARRALEVFAGQSEDRSWVTRGGVMRRYRPLGHAGGTLNQQNARRNFAAITDI